MTRLGFCCTPLPTTAPRDPWAIYQASILRLESECSNNLNEQPFNICAPSPYTRETYRYTPLLALLLSPNEWLHSSFGKFLFAACDIINGVIIYKLLMRQLQPVAKDRKGLKEDSGGKAILGHGRAEILATIFSSVYLLNPLVFSISTRGSSESVLSLFVLLTLDCALRDKWNLAAIGLGISTHWKIYPVIYAASCLAAINGPASGKDRSVIHIVKSTLSWRSVRFAAISAGTFLLLGFGCYIV